jgi:hypothetical protein
MIHLVRKWAERKSANACDWLAALYAITCKGSKSTGSIVFYAFPQELVNLIADRTGGRQVTVSIPDLISGEVWIDEDGNVYLLDQIDDGQGQVVERETFLMQCVTDVSGAFGHLCLGTVIRGSWPLDQFHAVAGWIDSDPDDDTCVPEWTRIAGHRATGGLDRIHCRRHVFHIQDHVRDRVLYVVRVAMHDYNRLAFVRLRRVNRRAEVYEDLRPARRIDAVNLLHTERSLIEFGHCKRVFSTDSHRVQAHLGVSGACEQQHCAYRCNNCVNPLHGVLQH